MINHPNRGMQTKWTPAVYAQLIDQLMRRFGPRKDWPGSKPVNRERYEQFIQSFASAFNVKPDGVQFKINFLMGGLCTHHHDFVHMHSAALAAKFITDAEYRENLLKFVEWAAAHPEWWKKIASESESEWD